MAKLFLVRHGESEWNKLGLWTGWTDIDLTEKGKEEARQAGEKLKNEKIDVVYVSDLKRAAQTFEEIKKVCDLKDFEYKVSPAIKERDYGIYTAKNKWQIKEEVGEEEFQKIRRGWDVAIPEGESLKDVYDRVVPYYESDIKKDLEAGKNVLVVAHGNSLRALVKYLKNISEDEIPNLEIATGEVYTI